MHEFELINNYFSKISKRNKSALGLNDDVFFDKNKGIVISLDTYLIGTHFVNFNSPKLVISKNKTTVGIGSGNTSRIDSVRFAIQKSSRTYNDETKREYNLNNCVMASDAFFPFTDSIKILKNKK